MMAVQKCQPAPFYILDEFDAALDDNYRQNIAYLIKEQSSQYLIVSFRKELMEEGYGTFFKVSHSNQQSSIKKTSAQEARLMVQE